MTEQELYEKIVDSIDQNMRDLMVVSVDYERLKTITPEMSLRLVDVNKRIKEVLQYIEDTEKQPTDHECLLPVDVEQDEHSRLNVSREKNRLIRDLKFLRSHLAYHLDHPVSIGLAGAELHYVGDPLRTAGMFISYIREAFPGYPLSWINTQRDYVIRFDAHADHLCFKYYQIKQYEELVQMLETEFTEVISVAMSVDGL